MVKKRRRKGKQQQIAAVKSLSRRATVARLKGTIQTARKLEDDRDGYVWELEKEGHADDAYDAMARGSSAGFALHRKRKR